MGASAGRTGPDTDALLDGLDPHQRAAVTSEAAPLCILAAAGSGKTRVLAHRIAHRIATGAADPRHVLALTFTRRAAGELRRRLRSLGVGAEVTAATFHAAAWAQLRRWADHRGVRPPRLPADFDDLLVQCTRALEEDPAFAEAQRWWWRHLVVDEYQDLNPAQFRLLRAWLDAGTDLTVVGDPHQAVYGWNGADPTLLDRFTEHFPTAEVVRLDTAYRCPPDVLRVATAVLPAGEDRAGPPRPPRHGGRPGGRVPTVRRYDTDSEEACGVARALRAAHAPGTPWSDLAVLARTNARLAVVEGALRQASIPHRSSFDLKAVPVRDALQWLARLPAAVPLPSALADLDADPAIDVVRELGGEYAALDRAPTTEGFLAWLRLVVRPGELDAAGDAVTLATFHRAKGLEWPVVFVVGLERGLVPIASAVEPEAVAEERRLLYVAATRARKTLMIAWAGTASRFLAPLRTEAERVVPRRRVKVVVGPAERAKRSGALG